MGQDNVKIMAMKIEEKPLYLVNFINNSPKITPVKVTEFLQLINISSNCHI